MRGSATRDRISLATRGIRMDRNKGTKKKDGEGRKKDGDTTADAAAEYNEVFTSAYGKKDDETTVDPFCKRTSLARTPSLRRTISLPPEVLIEDEDKGRGEDKRKRSEDRPPETAKKSREATVPSGDADPENRRVRLLRKVTHLIQKVGDDVEELYKITSGSKNTKVEIKDLAEDLSSLMKELTSVDLRVISEREEEEYKSATRETSTQTEQRGELRTKRTQELNQITML